MILVHLWVRSIAHLSQPKGASPILTPRCSPWVGSGVNSVAGLWGWDLSKESGGGHVVPSLWEVKLHSPDPLHCPGMDASEGDGFRKCPVCLRGIEVWVVVSLVAVVEWGQRLCHQPVWPSQLGRRTGWGCVPWSGSPGRSWLHS
uniref:Uncharacterized protein n=1 Tax=Chromera velia CCMP2878 TaxID=1169474 RepID=A0A0G4HFQ4_9ALVE|eukprot:Cvel_27151.t1-p1 / transcript=Cvel_27151.t1 / gene=Cvel_27151 / organism=Chromera_velia_CCMP2878 / gene_product=hypothetical protein / transcript_product=hypothetical protein / location=Cvel_scaffold3342:5607-6038(+) / protein_length=144 / sequence_SO=supercontig / SO=protein_coding / is_pseudo=false